jgi:Holliday junction resolvasome RuvABC endonuclease subunit
MGSPFWLSIPEGASDYRILATDPGTNTMGVSILSLCLVTGTIRAEYVTTLVAEKMITPYAGIQDYYGDRFTKLYALQNSLAYLMYQFQVDAVVSESPYLGRFPQAFAALTEFMCALRSAMLAYNPFMPITTIDPATIKTNVGVSGKSGDKLLMRNAVIALCESKAIALDPSINVYDLDEHSIDSLAAGYSRLRLLF